MNEIEKALTEAIVAVAKENGFPKYAYHPDYGYLLLNRVFTEAGLKFWEEYNGY